MKSTMPSWVRKLWSNGLECKWSMALEGLSPTELSLIQARLHKREFGPRSKIVTFGDKADALLIVEAGRMKMYHSNESGEEFTIGIWPRGYTVGLISTLLDQPRIVSVESVERTTMLALPRRDLFNLMTTIPSFSINIARLAASIARYSMMTTSPLALDSAAVRLGKVLANVAVVDNDHTFKPGLVVRGLNQDDLASMVGVSRTWVTLMLSTLEKNGVIWRKRRQIGIHDLDALQNFCQFAGEKNLRA
jgi:CRP/FNR family transcriptional regulator, cyclic AMP receptor protein